ncbi:uncharacterized protein A1O5_04439 [Cladophialophora psammophila CBS 110553]|uniref:AAA+ ATPase lid domain-containing protein n=1 Tax=Cladophialophora psammophila CBS 110553 TaxID=1182543 RepID=W9WVI6_9EURO|nr:uncharacterized protein A1O5_04439 [Cladophialophora psammophila CBS 110553]EXJ71938.1 hypothetical protein A1O5_04439 [Cladophialophora psammophila CBS 110553]
MPSKIPVFSFHDKKWRSLQVNFIRPVRWNENAFNRLVLQASRKELIQALVTVRLENNQATDVIEGKGAGLIMLLHRPPGTGKTLAAETVAELANKPLDRATCARISAEAKGVEKYLESALYLISLPSRSRVLQRRPDSYVELNRVGLFDMAFKSRMRLAIRYPPLDEAERLKIWDNFFKAPHEAGVGMELEDLSDNVKSLARKVLNGRQIRNVIKIARRLAAFRKQKLGSQHLECAIDVVEEFEKYLVDT